MKLYKLDSLKRLRYLDIYSEGPEIVQVSGLLESSSPITHRKACKPKNIGKSNETNAIQQANSEVKSLIEGKLTEGYFKSIEECNTEEVILPMLAKSYKEEKDKIDWSRPVFIQPKLDGMRCLAKEYLMSRQGKIISTVSHIEKSIPGSDYILDGELYIHGEGFQENMRLIKKYRKGETEKIQYWVYDLVDTNYSFETRYNTLQVIVKGIKNIVLVPTYKISNEKELIKYHKQFVADGYEGSIIRWGTAGYKVNGRSSNLLKYKDFQDLALPIIDIIPNDANQLHGTPIFELNGKQFKSGVKMSHKEREELLTNKEDYIGKTGEIRFFELSEEGTPRFPVFLGLRLDK